MEYLTYQEYRNFGFTDIESDEEVFSKLLPKATDVMHHVTRRFYEFADIQDDVEWRRRAFKKAIGAQIEYFYQSGATTSHELNAPSQVTIGRTTIGGRSGGSQQQSKSLVSADALMYLEGTGLLYRGVM